MKLNIDVSIYTDSDSIGHVNGAIELDVVPRIGETLCLMIGRDGVTPICISGFTGLVDVENVLHMVGQGTSLSLEDIVVQTKTDGLALMKFLEEAFGLAAWPTDVDD